MSHSSIAQASRDEDLTVRIESAISKEAWANETFGSTAAGATIKASGPGTWLSYFVWPVCIDTETDYEYAVNEGNPSPGGDPAVITDAAIQSAVQVHWPVDPS